MEDELERNSITLFKTNEELKSNENESIEILYVYIPDNEKIENYIITHNCDLLTHLAKEKNGRILFFKKDTLGLYKFYNK
jgi:hypothetical protein